MKKKNLIGKTVSFARVDTGEVVKDKVRDVGETYRLLMPYAPNEKVVAVVLTNYSWVPLDAVLTVED